MTISMETTLKIYKDKTKLTPSIYKTDTLERIITEEGHYIKVIIIDKRDRDRIEKEQGLEKNSFS